jgi:hypothetical protein
MMKATARVRRDGAESQMPAEDVALGFDRESPGLMARRPRPRGEFGWALVPPIALLVLWENGKLIARRSASAGRLPAAGGLPLAEASARKWEVINSLWSSEFTSAWSNTMLASGWKTSPVTSMPRSCPCAP